MSNYAIKRIGQGVRGISKKGNKFIRLKLDSDFVEKVAKHDMERGIYILEKDLTVICPMPKEEHEQK
jgi:hypothetical protein